MRKTKARRAACAICLVVGMVGPSATGTFRAAVPAGAATLKCPAEQYPPNGYPRSKAAIPYQIPFSGTLEGGTLTVGPPGTQAILGPANATICGYLTLPGEQGTIPVDSVQIQNPVPISIAIPGLTLLVAYLQLQATMTAQIEREPAANGGFNIDLYATFKATVIGDATVLGQQVLSVPELFGCTTAAGDQRLVGDSAADLDALRRTGYNFFVPIHFTTARSGTLTGKPVTGPPTAGQTEVVSNDFPYPQLFGDTPQVTRPAPPPNPGCNPTFLSLFNNALKLPQPPGNAQFKAPATFAIHVTA
jgi:hypothetical protein